MSSLGPFPQAASGHVFAMRTQLFHLLQFDFRGIHLKRSTQAAAEAIGLLLATKKSLDWPKPQILLLLYFWFLGRTAQLYFLP